MKVMEDCPICGRERFFYVMEMNIKTEFKVDGSEPDTNVEYLLMCEVCGSTLRLVIPKELDYE